MSDMLDWRVLARSTLRRWWLPVALALVGAVLGVYASTNLNPVYRSQGTVLVGPLDSTVTRSTTLRASESLAVFYADLARRETVLVPVRERLGLSMSLDELRNSVSAMVPDQNPRVVTVTVEGDSERQAGRIAVAIVDELVSLSPAPTGVTQPAFVSAQADALETSIQATEGEIDEMRASLAETTDLDEATSIRRSIDLKQQYLNDSRQTYVELDVPRARLGRRRPRRARQRRERPAGGPGRTPDGGGPRRRRGGRARHPRRVAAGPAASNRGHRRRRALRSPAGGAHREPGRPPDDQQHQPAAPPHGATADDDASHRPRAGAGERDERTMTAILAREVEPETLDLVATLCSSLADASVVYCHWKSNEALLRSLTGDNDLDLLVARPDQQRFLEVLARLGFKRAVLPPAREVPAVSHFYGLDRPTGASCTSTRTSGWSSGTTRPRTSGCPSRTPTWTRARTTSCCPSRPLSTSSPSWCCAWSSSTRRGTRSSSGAAT